MVSSSTDKHVRLWRALKKCTYRLNPKLKETYGAAKWNAYSLAPVSISLYAVLITWPRYNNMDYSYLHSSE